MPTVTQVRLCSLDGCETVHEAKGFCKLHYRRFKKYGDPLVTKIYHAPCIADGCDQISKSLGYCGMHYLRLRRHGNVDNAFDPKQCSDCSRIFTPHHSNMPRCESCRTAIVKLQQKASRERNRDNYLAAKRAWYANNQDQVKAYRASYDPGYYVRTSETKKAYSAQWKRLNKDKVREQCDRRRALKRGVVAVKFTLAELEQRLSMFGFKCWMCGAPYEHVDHVKPISKGGPHMLSNLRPACAPCNLRKKNKWPVETRMSLV